LLPVLYLHVTFIKTINSQQFRPAGSVNKGITVEVLPVAEGPTLRPHELFIRLTDLPKLAHIFFPSFVSH
jgi:hypothetical protein